MFYMGLETLKSMRERERETERHRERDRERKTERETERDTQRERERERQRDRERLKMKTRRKEVSSLGLFVSFYVPSPETTPSVLTFLILAFSQLSSRGEW